MQVIIMQRHTVLLEGHITLTVNPGTQVDLSDDIAAQGIRDGWCRAVTAMPGPEEADVVEPRETKKRRG